VRPHSIHGPQPGPRAEKSAHPRDSSAGLRSGRKSICHVTLNTNRAMFFPSCEVYLPESMLQSCWLTRQRNGDLIAIFLAVLSSGLQLLSLLLQLEQTIRHAPSETASIDKPSLCMPLLNCHKKRQREDARKPTSEGGGERARGWVCYHEGELP